jgi:hypothetical protein
MNSRTERYHKLDTEIKRRSVKNKDLYKDIYEDAEYTNIEKVTTIGRSSGIDAQKIKELLNDHKEEKSTRVIEVNEINEMVDTTPEKNYDLKDILNRAKEFQPTDEKTRSLKHQEYNIVKKAQSKHKNINDIKSIAEIETETRNLKEILNTLNSQALLEEISDKEMALNMLNNLQGEDSIEKSPQKGFLRNEVEEDTITEEIVIDKEFYTGSINNEDFKEVTKKESNIVDVILVILIILFAILGVYLGIQAI